MAKTSIPRVALLASHDHLQAKSRYLADVQAIKLRFFPAIKSAGNTDHSLFSSLPLYYAGSSKVLPRVFGPLGRTEKNNVPWSLETEVTRYLK